MSFQGVPTKSEVMRWTARSLADYMMRLKLSGCDKVVMKNGINGAWFLQMTDSDLLKFPSIHIPYITKICCEINRSEDKRGFGQRSKEPKHQQQDFVQGDEAQDSEKFEDSDGPDYEDIDEDEESYVCAMSEHGEVEGSSDGDYEAPPSLDTEDISRQLSLRTKPLGNDDYIDPVRGGPSVNAPPERTPTPRQRPGQVPQVPASNRNSLAKPPLPRLDRSPQRPFKAAGCKLPPSGYPIPQIERNRKPGQPALPNRDHQSIKIRPTREGSPIQSNSSPRPPIGKPPQPKPLKPQDHSNRPIKSRAPAPPSRPLPATVPNSQPGAGKGMDPRWYGGQMTRGQAEASLRQINKEGAFLVRDSSKGLSDQPYTLMVLNHGKVYNVQIRHQGNTYSLGTGLMGSESFPGVTEIINHHTQTPLLLINTMDRGSGAQSQCFLLHPAGH